MECYDFVFLTCDWVLVEFPWLGPDFERTHQFGSTMKHNFGWKFLRKEAQSTYCLVSIIPSSTLVSNINKMWEMGGRDESRRCWFHGLKPVSVFCLCFFTSNKREKSSNHWALILIKPMERMLKKEAFIQSSDTGFYCLIQFVEQPWGNSQSSTSGK